MNWRSVRTPEFADHGQEVVRGRLARSRLLGGRHRPDSRLARSTSAPPDPDRSPPSQRSAGANAVLSPPDDDSPTARLVVTSAHSPVDRTLLLRSPGGRRVRPRVVGSGPSAPGHDRPGRRPRHGTGTATGAGVGLPPWLSRRSRSRIRVRQHRRQARRRPGSGKIVADVGEIAWTTVRTSPRKLPEPSAVTIERKSSSALRKPLVPSATAGEELFDQLEHGRDFPGPRCPGIACGRPSCGPTRPGGRSETAPSIRLGRPGPPGGVRSGGIATRCEAGAIVGRIGLRRTRRSPSGRGATWPG